MNPELCLAVSPCPNDTFIFGAWALGFLPPLAGTRCAFIRRDVEELNALVENPEPGARVVKISAAQATLLGSDWNVLRSGAAFGFGAGPKLAVRSGQSNPIRVIAVPGLRTTAAALLSGAIAQGELAGRLDGSPRIEPVRYDLIAQGVSQGLYDAGLFIHETALVVDRLGLEIIFDLGRYWGRIAGDVPLPLGVIAAHASLGPELTRDVENQIQASLAFARQNPGLVRPLIKALAQEVDDAVIEAHIRAYVGDLSYDMGQLGRAALRTLSRLACAASPGIGA
jgi:1,4-dihydroxy-6-naphthoate synthase